MTKQQTKTKCVVYCRVSLAKQAERGQSLKAQREHCRAYAKLYGLEIVAEVTDRGASAGSLRRPGLQEALQLIESGAVTALLTSKLDRLTRSICDLHELLSGPFKTAELLSVAEQIDTRSASGRLVLNVLTSVAEWERAAIGERTSAVMQSMKARGCRVGSIPYGYQLAADGKTLEPCAGEQAIIERIRSDSAAGFSTRKVARALNSDGVPARKQHGSKQPGRWSHTTVHRILKQAA